MSTKNYFKILAFLIIIGLISSCSKNNDWNRFGLNGKVRSYLERNYEAEMRFGEWEKGDAEKYFARRVSFDKEGNCKWIEFFYNNELSNKLIPKKENGYLIESFYDEDGKFIKQTKINLDSKDEQGFIVYDKDGEKTIQGNSSYNNNNRIVSQQYQTFESNKIEEEYTVVFEYDKEGNLLSEKETDVKGEIRYFFNFKYLSFDENKNWTKRLDYNYFDGSEPEKVVIREYEYY